ncbi:MAG: hypothetical protein QNJ43_02620 [Breoghania sp.]|nr:hypothetical protein [Breoghania sp.]MDJ0929912.1 hypothetical protein [Breoghania sp.]
MQTPKIGGILETVVYVNDMEAVHGFYSGMLGLQRMDGGSRLHAYDAGPGETLLVFRRGRRTRTSSHPGGRCRGITACATAISHSR